MIILRTRRPKRLFTFECPYCGTLFQAYEHEVYEKISPIDNRIYHECDCPVCNCGCAEKGEADATAQCE